MIQIPETLISILPWAAIIIGIIALLLLMVKVVTGNEVLVVTGVGATKKKTIKDKDGNDQITYIPKIRIAGASIVIPFIQRSRRFDICVEKATVTNDTMKTNTGVEIVLDWGISYAPNADTVESLLPCIRQFLDKEKDEIQEIIRNVVAGGMRAVISTMTPQEVMVGKETLDDNVQKNISGQMAELGYKVQIYIQEVRDAEGSTYYQDLAAKDRETLKRDAANFTAEASQEIRKKAAETERAAKEAELDSQVTIAEKEKETSVKKAEFKAEKDRAEADAEVAGTLRKAEREREVVEKNGQIEVMRQEQANLAAEKEQVVRVTQAETAKREAIINAEADAKQREINANAAATVLAKEAEGRADAAKAEANGRAEAIKLEAEAEAEKTRMAGQAEADAIRAKGKAEAEAIEAKGKAEAESARALSDAQAANDRVNFEIAKLEIARDVQIQVATNFAQAMASVGEKATFYDFGGSSSQGGGNLLSNVLGSIPELMRKADLKNQALNGEPINDTISELMRALAAPLSKSSDKNAEIVSANSDEVQNSDDFKEIETTQPSESAGDSESAEEAIDDTDRNTAE